MIGGTERDDGLSGEQAAARPRSPVVRIALLVVGTLAAALAVLGLLMPVLPTTPFVLLAAACYLRSSDRLYGRLKSNRWFGPRLESWVGQRAVPMRVKIGSLILAWASVGSVAIWLVDDLVARLLLLGVLIGKTIFMAKVKTARPTTARASPVAAP